MLFLSCIFGTQVVKKLQPLGSLLGTFVCVGACVYACSRVCACVPVRACEGSLCFKFYSSWVYNHSGGNFLVGTIDNYPSGSVNVAVKPSVYVSFVESSFHEAPSEIEDSRLESYLSMKFINGNNWIARQHVRKTNSDLIFFVRWSLV